jgi:hypothetical protein
VTQNSRLLELPDLLAVIGEFDEKSAWYILETPRPEMDALASCLFQTVSRRQDQNKSRAEIFGEIWELVMRHPAPAFPQQLPVPHLDEPWYCCGTLPASLVASPCRSTYDPDSRAIGSSDDRRPAGLH